MRIIVAGMPRCGSTALFNTLREQLPGYQALFLREYHPGHIVDDGVNYLIKTHDFYRGASENTKVIYLFGSPYDVVNSFIAQPDQFKIDGFKNFGNNQEYVSDDASLISKDGMGLEWNFLSWQVKGKGILFVHYDVLFESSKEISEFIGYNILLPKRVDRKTTRTLHPPRYYNIHNHITKFGKIFING
jgi:hypothetical protein